MFYLFLSIVLNALLSIAMRMAEGRVKYKVSMLAGNYATCALMGLILVGREQLFTAAPGMPLTIGLGIFTGALYLGALVSCQYGIALTGIVLPGVFSRMGALLVPMGISMVLFGEMPGVLQVIGAVLSVVGILMMSLNGNGGGKVSHIPMLMIVLLVEGVACAMTKIYQEIGNTALSDNFLVYTFAAAFVWSVIVLLVRRERPGLMELVFGIFIGIPNFLCTQYMLRSIERMPAIIAYPCRSVGAIALVTLAGVLVFREKLTRRQVIALLVIVAAIVLLNL